MFLFAATRSGDWVPRPFAILERFGRNSLFIYWIHVELVYGYTTWVIHRKLPLWGTGVAYVVFCTAMFGAILLARPRRDLVADHRDPEIGAQPAARSAARA